MSRAIAIDYRMSRSSGIGVYLRHIVRHLADEHRAEFRLTLLGGDAVDGIEARRELRSPIYSISEQIELPVRIPRSTDVFWAPNYNAPVASAGRMVVTVHDLCHLALPDLFDSRLKARYARFMFGNVKRRAARVICVSKFTASELVRLTGIEPDRITVIYSAVDAAWRSPVDSARPVAAPYVLYVGNVKPHKNLGRLLEAMHHLQGRVPHMLAVVGKRDGFITPDRTIMAAAERLGSRVVFTGEVSEEVLRAWYTHADLLVYPSLYEGFGFPPLEAMAVGIPVAASNAASIPEICGEAAAYFDPYSIDEMSAVIEDAITNRNLRGRLRDAGRKRIERFSWATAATQVAEVFRDVTAG